MRNTVSFQLHVCSPNIYSKKINLLLIFFNSHFGPFQPETFLRYSFIFKVKPRNAWCADLQLLHTKILKGITTADNNGDPVAKQLAHLVATTDQVETPGVSYTDEMEMVDV